MSILNNIQSETDIILKLYSDYLFTGILDFVGYLESFCNKYRISINLFYLQLDYMVRYGDDYFNFSFDPELKCLSILDRDGITFTFIPNKVSLSTYTYYGIYRTYIKRKYISISRDVCEMVLNILGGE